MKLIFLQFSIMVPCARLNILNEFFDDLIGGQEDYLSGMGIQLDENWMWLQAKIANKVVINGTVGKLKENVSFLSKVLHTKNS